MAIQPEEKCNVNKNDPFAEIHKCTVLRLVLTKIISCFYIEQNIA